MSDVGLAEAAVSAATQVPAATGRLTHAVCFRVRDRRPILALCGTAVLGRAPRLGNPICVVCQELISDHLDTCGCFKGRE